MAVQISGNDITVPRDGSFTRNVTIGGTLTYEDVTNVDSIGIITARSTIDAQGDVSIADKIIHTGDTNTAIRFPASDKVTVETAGTERFAIEPAGNLNIPKSVVVGAAITVGSATSTSTFVGGGFLELTRSSGDSYIDFKNAFADDFDARIITSGGNQLQFFTGGEGATLCALQTSTAKVAIATDVSASISKLEIHSDKLGGTAGNTQELLLVKSPDIANSTTYRFTNYRKSNGTNHVTSELRFRRHVDVTDMGYFGLGDGYASIGYGNDERMRVSNDGYITAPQQPYLQVGITGNISVSANNSYEIVFNQENFDTASAYNTSNGRYVVPVTGDYLCTLDVQYTAEVNGFHAGIAVNNSNPGTNFDIWNHTGDGVRGDNIARVIRVTANESNYISFYTYTTSGGTLEVNRTKATIKFLG